jgi:5'-deoxynucleotidase YfbR-like HD superfamily hydrolase
MPIIDPNNRRNKPKVFKKTFEKFEDIVPPDIEAAIKDFYKSQNLPDKVNDTHCTTGSPAYNDNEGWIQTHSGVRFSPLEPIPETILIQDIAHALSMQCRFSGHVNSFYSVAQHSVGVSYVCDAQDALWGLLHDATEAYLIDVPSPLKRSGKFQEFVKIEATMQTAICKRFGLEDKEPPSVKKADKLMVVTEARDLMSPLRSDWNNVCEPLPFQIVPLSQPEAKALFLKRYFQLIGKPEYYNEYLFTEKKP